MNYLALAAALAVLTVGVARAQSTAGTTSTTGPAATGPAPPAQTATPPAPSTNTPPPASGTGTMQGATPGAAGLSPPNPPSASAPNAAANGNAAASGNANQAVATTGVNANAPANGANSFTMGQAATRIANHGYSHVTSLKKDQRGVWRGQATKGGRRVAVWLDYKGNVGQR